MPRVKKIDFSFELSKLDDQIKDYEQALSDLKEKRKQLEKQKEEKDISILYNYIKQSGKSINDFMEQVNLT